MTAVGDAFVTEREQSAEREALTSAAEEVLRASAIEVGCEADVGYYDAHMEIQKMLRERARGLRDGSAES